ncbi:cold-shock protein, DNA-binding domain containing protein [Rhodotorula toruloides]|uniref:Cold-shock protein, DNA-binding domain containing protein n=1 Tax=Rhodotorula toruloides TaxID=5286 RepID=A0A511KP18_RHOTO|nr:cold-shock protein, DNA-binding domain containing protein [Rhodotorula toruloides]
MTRTRSASYSSPKTSTGFDLPLDAPPSPPSSATPTRTRRHSLAGSRSPTPPLQLYSPMLSSCFLPSDVEPSAAGLAVPASPPGPSGLQGFQSVVSPLVYFDIDPCIRESSTACSPPFLQHHDFHPFSPPPTLLEASSQPDPGFSGFATHACGLTPSGLGLHEPLPTVYPISSRTYSPDFGCFPPSSPVGFSPPTFQFFCRPTVPYRHAYVPSPAHFPLPAPPPEGCGFSAPPPSPHSNFQLPQTPLHLPSPPIASTPTLAALSTTGKTASQLLEEGEAFWSTGTCKFFDVEKGYGFIVDDHSQEIKLDVFAHYTGVYQKRGFRCLAPGERVEYVLTKLSNGKLQAFRIEGENGEQRPLLPVALRR